MRKMRILFLCMIFVFNIAFIVPSWAEAVRVSSLAGDVKIIPAGETKEVACTPEMELKPGDRILTGDESRLEMYFDKAKQNTATVESNSNVVIRLQEEDKIELIDGELITALNDLGKGEVFRVRTPSAVCGARGTIWDTAVIKGVTTISTLKDRVFVRGVNKDGSVMEKEFWVKEGYERKIKKFERPEKMLKISRDRFEKLREKADIKKKEKKVPVSKKKARMLDRARRERKMDRIEKIEEKDRVLEDISDIRDKSVTNVIEQKDETRLDSVRDKLDDSSNTGTRITKP